MFLYKNDLKNEYNTINIIFNSETYDHNNAKKVSV